MLNKLKCPNEDTSVPLEREREECNHKWGGTEEPGREGGQGEGTVGGRGESDLVLGEEKELKP